MRNFEQVQSERQYKLLIPKENLFNTFYALTASEYVNCGEKYMHRKKMIIEIVIGLHQFLVRLCIYLFEEYSFKCVINLL